jgi:neutral ceramidase
MANLTAGASKVCINLPDELLPYPVPEWFGGGEFVGVKDDIFVRALALSDGNEKVIFITAELGTYFNAEDIQRRIESETGVPFSNILISATHTHEVPEGKVDPDIDESGTTRIYTDREKQIMKCHDSYNKFLEDQSVKAAEEALSSMVPVKIGYGEGTSYINCNRDEFLLNGVAVQGLNPAGPSDKTLSVLEIRTLNDRKLALLINYAVHNNFCMRQKNIDGNTMKTYGDISEEVCSYLERRYADDGLIAIWTNGAAGNQNPYIMAELHHYLPDGRMDKADYELREKMWDVCRYLGERQGQDVVRVLRTINNFSDTSHITSQWKKYQLPGTKVLGFTREMLIDANLIDASKIHNEPSGKTYPLGLMLITIGDLAYYGINGEVMCETGLRLKAASPFKHTILITYMGDNPAGKYMVDNWGYEHHTFEYFRNTIEKGRAEECMTSNLLQMSQNRFKTESNN